ncbi:MAG: four helix bundle protein [Saprospiraceae bacterium]|jgi:four helix bundle protein|nr:four helix bundle protein [Saprospiraceae bacterium]
MKQEEFNELFRARTKKSALSIIAIVSDLKYSDALSVIIKQLIRSVTSVAANYRAVCRARSEKEKYAKLCIVVEEADETLFWIEMLIDGGFITEEKLSALRNESEEILKVMSSYRSKLKPINH